MSQESHLAAIGTYSAADETGVYTAAINADTGEMSLLDGIEAGPDPTFVTPHPTEDVLYAAVRTDGEGTIAVYDVERENGSLEPVDRVPSGALSPCHCSVGPSGEFLFVAHYAGGAVSILPLDGDGQVAASATVVQHTGSSVHPERQTEPHPHSITPGPNGRFVYVPDLGTDEIVVYEVDRAAGALTSRWVVDVEPGSGPRHLSFGPENEHVYLINELNSTVVAYTRAADGSLSARDSVSTLPEGFDGENKTAEVAVHPSGEFLFASNRGHDTVATLAHRDGELQRLATTSTGGEWPRHFAIDPTGRFLFVENRDSDEIRGFEIDGEAGALKQIGSQLAVSEPVCLRWFPE